MGYHAQGVDETHVPYIMPTENGNHADTQWVLLTPPGPGPSPAGGTYAAAGPGSPHAAAPPGQAASGQGPTGGSPSAGPGPEPGAEVIAPCPLTLNPKP